MSSPVAFLFPGFFIVAATLAGCTQSPSRPAQIFDAASPHDANGQISPATGFQLTFTAGPQEAAAGEIWTPPPSVAVSAAGRAVPGALAGLVGAHLRLSLGAGEGPLLGTAQLALTGGEVTFPDLAATQSGSKTLTATLVDADGAPLATATPADSAPFTVAAGAAAKLRAAAAPSQALVGVPLFPAPAWALLDAYDNPADLGPGETVALGLAGDSAPLRGARSLAAASGEVAFAGVDLDTAGIYQLQATLAGAAGSGPPVPAAVPLVALTGPPTDVATPADEPGAVAAAAALQVDGGALHTPRERQMQQSFAPGVATPRGLALDAARGGLTLAAAGGCDATATQCAALDSAWAPRYGDLVGHWTFDGAGPVADGATLAGTVGPDLVAANADGAGLAFVEGQVGQALALDGVDDAILLPAGFPGSSAMTFAVWVRVDQAADDAHFLFLAHDTSNYIALSTVGSGYRNSNMVGGGPESIASSEFGMVLGVWQHVALTVDGAVATTYLNGKPVAACDALAVPAGFLADVSSLGRNSFNPSHFKGALDEVAIWQVALTDDEIAVLYDRQASPRGGFWTSAPMAFSAAGPGWQSLAWHSRLAGGKLLPRAPERAADYPERATPGVERDLAFLWHLDEAALGGVAGGADFADSAGAGNHGQAVFFQPSPPVKSDVSRPGVVGPFGRALMMGHSAPEPCVVTHQTLPGLSALSVQAWFSSGSVEGGRIIGFADSAGSATSDPDLRADRHLYLTPTGRLVFGVVQGGVQKTVISPASVADSAWHHAVGTLDATSGLALWVDGQRVAHDLTVTAADAYDGAWRMGWQDIANSGWPQAPQRAGFFGLLSEVAVWSRALASDEILELYRRGSERIRIQLRSCADAACSADPPWRGPDGAPTSAFCEAGNRDAAGPLPWAPTLPLTAVASLPGPATHPYMQMRVQMDAGDVWGLCVVGGGPAACQPALARAEVAAAQATPAGASATFRLADPPRVLSRFTETLGPGGCPAGVGYALSLDGTTFFAYGGGVWVPADIGGANASGASLLDAAAMRALGRQVGVPAGTVYVRAHPRVQGAGGCALMSVGVGGSG